MMKKLIQTVWLPVRSLGVIVVGAVLGKAAARCDEASRLASEARDRKLSRTESIRMHFHRMICRECTRYARQLRLMGDIAREEKPLPPLPEEAKRRLAQAVNKS